MYTLSPCFSTVNIPENISFEDISIFPNPSVDYISINSSKKIAKIKLINLNGEVIINEINPNQKTISISTLKKGVYFIILDLTDNSLITKKVVKL